MIDVIKTLNNLTADVESDPLPPGHYLGLWVRVTGTGGAGETDAMLGDIIVKYQGGSFPLSEIWLTNGADWRNTALAFGGQLETTNGAAFAYSFPILFGHGNYPNSLYVGARERMTFKIQKTQSATVTASEVEISSILTDSIPMNYIPIVSERQSPALGGLQSTPLNLSNLLWIAMTTATVTDPTTVTIKSSRGKEKTFTPASLRAATGYIYDVDQATFAQGILSRMNGDFSDVFAEDFEIMTSGGVGTYNYLTASAVMDPALQNLSRTIQAGKIAASYARVGASIHTAAGIPLSEATGIRISR